MKAPINQALANSISQRLKEIRAEKALSLDKAAALTGVSKAMLGQIERMESSPTIAVLWKIASGLSCSFSSFLQNSKHVTGSDVEQFVDDPNMSVKTLFPFDAQKGFEVFEITLKNNHVQISSAHQTGVTEHIHVTEGSLGLKIGEKWIEVGQGQQSILNADLDHGYRDNVGKTTFIVVIHYPVH